MLKIKCGEIYGYLFPERFGPGGRSVCVKLENNENSKWISLIDFERKAGKGEITGIWHLVKYAVILRQNKLYLFNFDFENQKVENSDFIAF